MVGICLLIGLVTVFAVQVFECKAALLLPASKEILRHIEDKLATRHLEVVTRELLHQCRTILNHRVANDVNVVDERVECLKG